jgi:uncharacterized DUF497 family protein
VQYNFEWNPAKAKENLKKHRIAFERAAQVFNDPFAVSVFDDKHSTDEDRWITLGKDDNDVPLVVVHTFREITEEECTVRVISVRKATKMEMKQYPER